MLFLCLFEYFLCLPFDYTQGLNSHLHLNAKSKDVSKYHFYLLQMQLLPEYCKGYKLFVKKLSDLPLDYPILMVDIFYGYFGDTDPRFGDTDPHVERGLGNNAA